MTVTLRSARHDPPGDVAVQRTQAMLIEAMGHDVGALLTDPLVIEIMANADGTVWVDSWRSGRTRTAAALETAARDRIIRLVASHLGLDAGPTRPIVSGELPGSGQRFEGVLPPVASAPCFAIRKVHATSLALTDLVTAGVVEASQAACLAGAVRRRRSILVIGGTSTGKTTLAGALLQEVAATGDRVVLLEDTRELFCPAADLVALRTFPGVVSLSDLVRTTLRLRPDRIIVGEVRGGEALDLLKAWTTGHAGGIATLHAGTARAGLERLEQLAGEVARQVPRALIAEAVDMIVVLARAGPRRFLRDVLAVDGLDPDGRYRLRCVDCPEPDFEETYHDHDDR